MGRHYLFPMWEGGGNVPPILGVARRLIEHTVIEGFEANTDILRFHVPTDAKEPTSHCLKRRPAQQI